MNLAIIQARMSSIRLPGKVLKFIGNEILIDIIYNRISHSKAVDKIIVACTTKSSDDILIEHLTNNNIDFFRGDEDDVLSRFYLAAKDYNPINVVRITCDDPLKEPSLIDKALDLITKTGSDYVSNTITPSYPEGLDVEVFTFKALEKAYLKAKLPSEREHVTPYIWKNAKLFKVTEFCFILDASSLRWTVDKKADLDFFNAVEGKLGPLSNLKFEDLLFFLIKNPEFAEINNKTIRNEGYLKSIQEEMDVQ